MYSLHLLVADPTECLTMSDSPLSQVHFRVRDRSTPMNPRPTTSSLGRTIFISLLISKITQWTFSTIRSSTLQRTPFILVGFLPPCSPIELGVGLPCSRQASAHQVITPTRIVVIVSGTRLTWDFNQKHDPVPLAKRFVPVGENGCNVFNAPTTRIPFVILQFSFHGRISQVTF